LNFESLSVFDFELKKLSKKRKYYGNCQADVDGFFSKLKSIQDALTRHVCLLKKDDITVVKCRIPNSSNNFGKSGGYRVLYLVNPVKNHVCKLFLFAKKNTYGIGNISSEYLEYLILEYQKEFL